MIGAWSLINTKRYMSTFNKSSKIITFVALLCIIAASLLINNSRLDLYPHGPDEQTYIGAANRMVLFENKELTVFFPQADNLIPYILGLAAKYSGIDTMIIFRIVGALLNVATIFLFYLVGKKISSATALILAALSAFCVSSTYWLGPAYMVPSTVILAVIPLLTLLFLESRYVITVLVFLGTGLLYWWALAPLSIFILLYLIFLSKHRLIFLLIFFTLFGVISEFFLSDFIQKILGSEGRYPLWYRDALFKYILPYALISIIAIVLFIKRKKYLINRYDTKVFFIAVSLILTNIAFLVFFNEQTQARTFYFLLFGLLIFTALSFDIILRTNQVNKLFILPFVLFFIFFQIMNNTALNNKNDVFKEVQLSRAENAAMKWLGSNTGKDSAVFSDWGSVLLSNYYNNNKNYYFIGTDSVDYKMIAKIIQEGKMKGDDWKYIQNLLDENNLKNIYLLISLRTCYWLDYSKKELLFSRELPKWYNSCSSQKIFEFDAPLIYKNDEVYIYRII